MQKDNMIRSGPNEGRIYADVLSEALDSNPRPQFFTLEQYRELIANGHKATSEPDYESVPVVKLFTPDAGATWLIAEIDPLDTSIAFGLCDLWLGSPEIGSLDLDELAELRGHLGLPVERDRHFEPNKTLSAYAKEARDNGSTFTL